MANFYREVRRALIEAGCEFVREGKGSHEIWRSPISMRTFTVPKTLKRKPTAEQVFKDAGLAKKI